MRTCVWLCLIVWESLPATIQSQGVFDLCYITSYLLLTWLVSFVFVILKQISTLNMCKRKERCGWQQVFWTNLSCRLQRAFLIKKCLSVCGKLFTFLNASEPQMFPVEVLYLFWVILIPWWPPYLVYDWLRLLLSFQNYWMSSHQTCTNAHLAVLKTFWRELIFKWRPLSHW